MALTFASFIRRFAAYYGIAFNICEGQPEFRAELVEGDFEVYFTKSGTTLEVLTSCLDVLINYERLNKEHSHRG